MRGGDGSSLLRLLEHGWAGLVVFWVLHLETAYRVVGLVGQWIKMENKTDPHLDWVPAGVRVAWQASTPLASNPNPTPSL